MPIEYMAGRKFAGPLKIDIKVSNDGKAKSNTKSLIVYDSRCFECNNDLDCKQKVKFDTFFYVLVQVVREQLRS